MTAAARMNPRDTDNFLCEKSRLVSIRFSSQQPLRFATLSTSRCGSVTRGSDSPPGGHLLPLARLRLRLAYPLHKCNFAVLQSKIAADGSKAKFHIKPHSGLMRAAFVCGIRTLHYQPDFPQIFSCHIKKPPPRFTQATGRRAFAGVAFYPTCLPHGRFTYYLSGLFRSSAVRVRRCQALYIRAEVLPP